MCPCLRKKDLCVRRKGAFACPRECALVDYGALCFGSSRCRSHPSDQYPDLIHRTQLQILINIPRFEVKITSLGPRSRSHLSDPAPDPIHRIWIEITSLGSRSRSIVPRSGFTFKITCLVSRSLNLFCSCVLFSLAVFYIFFFLLSSPRSSGTLLA